MFWTGCSGRIAGPLGNNSEEHRPIYRITHAEQASLVADASYFGRSFSARQPRTSDVNIEPLGTSAIWWGSKRQAAAAYIKQRLMRPEPTA